VQGRLLQGIAVGLGRPAMTSPCAIPAANGAAAAWGRYDHAGVRNDPEAKWPGGGRNCRLSVIEDLPAPRSAFGSKFGHLKALQMNASIHSCLN